MNKPDLFLQGYCCAISNLIYLTGGVNTYTRELWTDGIGQMSINDLKKAGVDPIDLERFEIYFNELNHRHDQ